MYLPESFEWMILNAGVVQEKEIMEILKEPEKYIKEVKNILAGKDFSPIIDRED